MNHVLAAAALLFPCAVFAQSYPDRPLRLVVPFAVGGALDVVARIIGQKLTESWGRQVIIDNRLGAGGNIGAEYVAKAAPDGYTLLMSSVTTQVPYKGGGQAVSDLLSGQMQFAFSTIQLALPHVESGRLRMLGIGSVQRFPRLPDLPTVAESGVAGYEAEQWYGVIAPRGTPPPIISKLSAELRGIVASADFRERMLSQGIAPVSSTPEAFAATIRQNIARFAKVIKELGLKVE